MTLPQQDSRKRVYLGDGLYASDDGFMITLITLREEGEHWVGLEPQVLTEMLQYIARERNLKIRVKNPHGTIWESE